MGDEVIHEDTETQQIQDDHLKPPRLEDIVGNIVDELFQQRLKTAEEQHLTQRQSIQTYTESLTKLQEDAEKILNLYLMTEKKAEELKAHKRVQSAVAPGQLAVIKETVTQPVHSGMHHAPSAAKLTNNSSTNGASTTTNPAEKNTFHSATTRNTPASSVHQAAGAGAGGASSVPTKTHMKSDKLGSQQAPSAVVSKKKETPGAINSAKEDMLFTARKTANIGSLLKQHEKNDDSVANSNSGQDSQQILSELNIKTDQKEGNNNNSAATSETNTKQELSTEQLETGSDSLQTNSTDRKSLVKAPKQTGVIGKKQPTDEKTVKSGNKVKGNDDQKLKDNEDNTKGVKVNKKQDVVQHSSVTAEGNGGAQRKTIPKISDLKTQRELIKNKQKETDQNAGKSTETNTRKSVGIKKEEGGAVSRSSVNAKKEDHVGGRLKTEESANRSSIPGKKVAKINSDNKGGKDEGQDDKNKKKATNNDGKSKINGSEDNSKDSKGDNKKELKNEKSLEKNDVAVEGTKEDVQDHKVEGQIQDVVAVDAEDEDLLANIKDDGIQGEEQIDEKKKNEENEENDKEASQGNGKQEQVTVEEFSEKKLEELLSKFSNSEITINDLKDYCLKYVKSKEIIEDKIIFQQINLQNDLEALQAKNNGVGSQVIPEASSFVFKLTNSTKEGLSLVDTGFFDDILSKEELDSKIVALFELLLMIVDGKEIKEMQAESNKDLFVRNYLNEFEDSFTSVLEDLESKGQQLLLNYPLKKQIQGFITEHEYVLDQNEYTSLDPLSSIISPILKEVVIFAGIKESNTNKGNVAFFQSQEIEHKQKQIQEINDLIVQIS